MTKNLKGFLVSKKEIAGMSNVERKKYLQKLKIIKHLFLNGETSNSDICSRFNVSLPTLMTLINQLKEAGIVVKTGQGKSEGGRKPDLFGLREHLFFVLSIHIERASIKLAIIDNNQSIIAERTVEKELSPSAAIVEDLHNLSKDLLADSKISGDQLMGVGVSMPGLVSTEEGKNFTYYLSEQDPIPLQKKLEATFNKPVAILNDAKSSCLAEFRYGLARNKQDVLVISMDWGIGLGIIMGGKMHSGTSGFAGEFGHIPMTEDGKLCHCGKRGCLETEASGLALVQKAQEGLDKGQTSILNDLLKTKYEKLEPQVIIEAANKGDQFAISVISDIGIQLGKGISVLVQIFNPELIILEGKISEARQFITTPIQQSMNTYCMMQLKERTKIELSTLGPNSSLYGGIIAVMENIFQEQTNLIKTHIN
ncbi:ROK family transcriptional regulator [Gramella sp. GC03-9]|uniref:ROK family transcriptional regulator n=1 Tax=Christiangramia oceanisediminis TaxID=2920386 RepID=A0A9X2I118_9FLAO|nr:ROK family transcriptional regulator [Gramella oceanisediminis]MCP9199264.1 ROK family transcriptional regulator [Gramella oceanisediminis]